MAKATRAEMLTGVSADYHGAIDFAELAEYGISPDEVIDFSVNSNPFGPADGVLKAIRSAKVVRYPDKECLALRSAISGQIGVPMANIMAGNGSAELMWLIAFTTLVAGDDVLVIGPTFGEYQRNARLMGASVTAWRASADDDFRLDVNAIKQIEAEIERLRPQLVHLCNPNNPTGQWVEQTILEKWSAEFPETIFVIDEAYQQFVVGVDGGGTYSSLRSQVEPAPVDPYGGLSNMIIMRSMTKDYSLAGLRLGYVVGPQNLIDRLRQCRVPWSVSEVAQAAGVAALAAQAEYEAMWQQLRTEAEKFKGALEGLGYRIIPSKMHYFLMEVEDGAAFRERLLRQGMLARKCESFGLPSFVRISTQRPDENQKLLAHLTNAP